MRIAYKNLEEIPEVKRLLGRHRHRREDVYVLRQIQKKEHKDMAWTLLAWVGSRGWTS